MIRRGAGRPEEGKAHLTAMESFRSGSKSIRVDVLEPPGTGVVPALVLLHGAGGNTRFWLDRMAPHVAEAGFAIYAVHYFDRTGTVRADEAAILDGRHFPLWLETVRDGIGFVAGRERVDKNRLALLGISLGAFLAIGAAAAEPTERALRAVIAISGGWPGQFAPATVNRDFPPTLLVHGEADTVVPVQLAREMDSRLTRAGVPHQTLLLPGEGHWFSGAAQLQILSGIATFLPAWTGPLRPERGAAASP